MADRIPHDKTRFPVIVSVYVAWLIVYLVASFYPEHRIWGLNLWAHLPGIVPIALFLIGVTIPIIGQYWLQPSGRDATGGPAGDRQTWPTGLYLSV